MYIYSEVSIFLKMKEKTYIKKNLHRRPNILCFKEIMSSKNKQNLISLCKFIKIINKRVSPLD